MDIYVLNKNLEAIAIIDSYKSLIWTKRYYTYGDFELYVPANKDLLNYLKQDYFLVRDDDESVMIIEKIEMTTSIEEGDFFIITGRSLESILTRRIIWHQTNISTSNPVNGIYQFINSNAINPSSARRKIPNLSFDSSFSLSATLNIQRTGDNLMDVITEICTEFGIGFKIILQNNNFICSCYQGEETDVIFSKEFDNLISSDYANDFTNYKNCGLAAGEGEGTARKTISVWNTSSEPTGLNRREIYIDARDMSTNEGEITENEYLSKLSQRGKENLNEFVAIKSFQSEIETRMTYQYKTDYNLGDIVSIVNEFGITSTPRIIEIIESWDETGYTVVPTFEELEVE